LSFTWEEICEKWITSNCEEYDQEELVNAFSIIEKHLSREWLETKYQFIRGPVVIIPILELSRIIKTLESNDKFHVVIDKLKKNIELDLARLAAFYTNHGLNVEIEPKVQVNGRTRVPDLRVKFDDTWVYFEAYTPSASTHYRQLSRKIRYTASKVINSLNNGVDFQIYFIREPNKAELESFIQACGHVAVVNEEKHYSYHDLAKLIVKPLEGETAIDNGKYIADGIRRFFFVIGSILNRGIQKKCLVGMPFTDKRVDRILRNQYPQLSKKECNVVSIDLSHITGDFDLWVERLESRLKGNNYRRIGAIILTHYTTNTPENERRLFQESLEEPGYIL